MYLHGDDRLLSLKYKPIHTQLIPILDYLVTDCGKKFPVDLYNTEKNNDKL
jgi:hypothetical protein